MRWAEIAIESTEASADAVTDILLAAGCAGTSSQRAAPCTIIVKSYLPVDDRLEASLTLIKERVSCLSELGLDMVSDEVSVKWVDDEKWATAWRKFFKPLRIGRIVIKPSWEDFEPSDGEVVVEIDPGMAFGTGSHSSTKLCILALQEHIKGEETVLDVGTGSGILALAAAKLGATRVIALDNDPIAIRVAIENTQRIGLENVLDIKLGDTPMAFDGMADVVIANIIPNVIIPMAEALKAKVKPGGTVITSGIVIQRAAEVRAALEAAGLLTYQQWAEDDWIALVSRRMG